ncbi:MAG: TetR family transcriptional regulator [Leuconostoc fallax]
MSDTLHVASDSKTHILDAATTLFLKNGYEQTTTREIARALGMTQPALYHHFHDKEVLFVEVMQQVGQSIRTELENILKRQYNEPIDQLVAMTLVIRTQHPRDVFTLIHGSFGALSSSGQQSLGRIFGRDYVGPIARFFAQPAVHLREHVDPKMASSFYITSLAPIFGDFHALNAQQDIQTRVQELVDLILHGVVR